MHKIITILWEMSTVCSFITICLTIRGLLLVLCWLIVFPTCSCLQCTIAFLQELAFLASLVEVEILTVFLFNTELIAFEFRCHCGSRNHFKLICCMFLTSLVSCFHLRRLYQKVSWKFEDFSSLCFNTKLEPE